MLIGITIRCKNQYFSGRQPPANQETKSNNNGGCKKPVDHKNMKEGIFQCTIPSPVYPHQAPAKTGTNPPLASVAAFFEAGTG
jgi:hypothetical protein